MANAVAPTPPPAWVQKVLKYVLIGFGALIVIGIVGGVVAGSGTTTTTTTTTSAPSFSQSEFTSYVSDNFGDVNWTNYITRMYSSGSALWIETSLYKDSDAYQPAKEMCVAASMFIIADPQSRFSSLTIRSSTGERLVLRNQLTTNPTGSTCDPEL